MRAPTIDLPCDAGRAWRPGSIEDRQIGIVQNAPDRAGMRKPFLGTAEGERAGFGPAIMFEDDGPPPVDHCFLEMRRTGRRAMHDEAEARQVVALANLLRKLEQQREHRRNDRSEESRVGKERVSTVRYRWRRSPS